MNETTPGDARSMMDVIDEQQRRVDRDLQAPTIWLYAIWGAAWLLGYLALYLAFLGSLSGMAAGIIFAALIVGSIVASAIVGSRIGRGLRGDSAFAGTVYGVSWTACSIAFALLGIGLIAQGLPDDLIGIYFPSAYALMCGALYLSGAALWGDRLQLVLGALLLLVGGLVPFLGYGPNLLAMAIAGGVLFGGGAIVSARRLPR